MSSISSNAVRVSPESNFNQETANADKLDTEAKRELLARVGKQFKSVPATLIVDHILSIYQNTDFAIQREAFDQISKRFRSADTEKLIISSKPLNRKVYGVYQTKRKAVRGARPYETALISVEPLKASCSCPDFRKNSLGTCKHVATVLLQLYSNETARKSLGKLPEIDSALRWHPIRDLTGRGDFLGQVYWSNWKIQPELTSREIIKKWFHLEADGNLVLRNLYQSEPAKRLELVNALLLIEKGQRANSPDPALKVFLEEEKSLLEVIIKSQIEAKELKQHLKTLKLSLYPYQRDGVTRFFETGRLLLGDDMGLGKTAQSIAISHVLVSSKRVKKVLVVVPASLKGQWLREWQVFTDIPAEIVDGRPEERKAIYNKTKSGVLIVNYEQVLKDLEVLLEWKPDFMVLDEAQRIKNWETKTALTLKKFSPPYRLILTGTPLENRLEELSSIMDWLDPRALAPHWRLNCLHTIAVDGEKRIAGVKNLETVRSRIAPVFLRRLRQDVLGELPSRTDTRIPITLTPLQIEMHDDLARPILQLMNLRNRRPLTQMEFLQLMKLLNRQRMISNGVEQVEFDDRWPDLKNVINPKVEFLKGLSSPKLIELREIISQIVVEQGRKVVIFSQWRKMLKLAEWAVSGILTPARLRSAFFSGQESPKRRTENIVAFHDDPSMRILFATDAGGVGLNLQRAANCCINLELPWNPAVLEQRIGRIYRNGQKNPVDIFNLVADYGIESRVLGLVASKRALFTNLFDGSSNEVVFEESASFLEKIKEFVSEIPVGESVDLDDDYEGIDDRDVLDEQIDIIPEDLVLEPEKLDVSSLNNTDLKEPPIKTGFDLPSLLSQIKIERSKDGGITLSAPPSSAALLADLFEGFGKLLRDVRG